jgi:GT2 family glycosyltransferase
MKFSIITAFNYSSNFIVDNIYSVNKQSYKDLEHIFIGLDKNDPTINVINRFSSNPKIFFQDSRGIYNAFNNGLKRSTGDIFIFLNSDDWFYDSDVLQNIFKIFSKNDIEMVFGNILYVDRFYPYKIKRQWNLNKFNNEKINPSEIPHPSLFIKKDLLEKIKPFNEKYKIAGDFDFIKRSLNVTKKISYINNFTTVMRHGGVSNSSPIQYLKSNIESFKSLRDSYSIYASSVLILNKILYKIPQFIVSNSNINPPTISQLENYNYQSKHILTVSIVIFNTEATILQKTINSLLFSNIKIDIFLVDVSNNYKNDYVNDSRINYLFIGKNIGFGKAHNIIINNIKNHSGYHLCLNPDVYFDKKFLINFLSFIKSKKIDTAIPNIRYPNGRFQRSYRNFPSFMDLLTDFFIKQRFENDNSSNEKIKKVQCPSGCFILSKIDILKKINGFDERYFLYFEDVDLYRRITNINDIFFIPDFEIYHYHRKESSKSLWFFCIHISSYIKYFFKWLNK